MAFLPRLTLELLVPIKTDIRVVKITVIIFIVCFTKQLEQN